MFDRCPDAQLVTDLVAVQGAAPVMDADAAAVHLLEQAVAWDRVSAWVEYQKLDTLRRFQAARVDADTQLSAEMESTLAKKTPAQRAALLRMRAELDAEAGRFAAEEIALALNISPTAAHRQLALATDLHTACTATSVRRWSWGRSAGSSPPWSPPPPAGSQSRRGG